MFLENYSKIKRISKNSLNRLKLLGLDNFNNVSSQINFFIIFILAQIMSFPNSVDFKGLPRKLYPNPSATNLTNKLNLNGGETRGLNNHFQNNTKKPIRVRRTDHTDEHISERSPSRSGVFVGNQAIHQVNYGLGEQEGAGLEAGSRVSRRGSYNIRMLSQNQQKMIELKERLKNIHHFYRIRIQQQRNKNLERNQIFIGVIEDLQKSHNEKLVRYQKSLEDIDDEKKDVNYVDQRMESIKSTIEQILSQSRELKEANDNMQKAIMQKQLEIKQKQDQQVSLKEEIDTLRGILENCERLKLKENKRSKQLLEIIQNSVDY